MHAPEAVTAGDTLPVALAQLLDGLPPKQAAQAVERLIANYRGRTPTDAPVLRDRSDVAAYAAYRMPATFEAVRAALGAFRHVMPGFTPASHVDVGGGTGAASWAVADAWPGADRTTVVLDWAEAALELGRELAGGSGDAALRAAEWRRAVIGAGLRIPDAELVTVSYVLGELTEEGRSAVVAEAARAASAVVVVEPGTPEGYLRIREARDRLVAAGLSVVAPCPHSGTCPIAPGTDWCHFAARVSRSSLHRQVKGGSLPYEDEKFSYVAAVREPGGAAAARVVRKPQIRKGQVLLELCTEGEGLRRETVTKRHGPLYRAARDTGWGDAWPPEEG
ncbi:small ribosomal subunit Rsm22 family protein [Streptomyces sp. XD-27]|uniref:small ribosomal subunit Rsm22 family protein n=1 Tax=Streptomyces sp. XD-27 TaxID=3062779 RepID=UPI0026F449C8|nr:small ribosomal subunit Rsm22 family protein [Streptomyces sp. XD-27]WKX70014.1 small ribosomal subunit Rsm22 family protein [Streptomyces sp. XD-27]